MTNTIDAEKAERALEAYMSAVAPAWKALMGDITVERAMALRAVEQAAWNVLQETRATMKNTMEKATRARVVAGGSVALWRAWEMECGGGGGKE